MLKCTYSHREDKTCDIGYECVHRAKCGFYKEELQRSEQFSKKSKDRNDIIQSLRALICNTKDKKVCCKIQSDNDPESPGYLPGNGDCGLSEDAAFIVGGTDTKPGEFPWSALIRKQRPDDVIRWHCGGVLINKWYVVSAAHCDDDDSGIEEVRLGEWKVKEGDNFDKRKGNPIVDCDTCPDLQDIKVALVQKHPNYGRNYQGVSNNDIMIIKLSRPAVYNRMVKPVCLPPPDFDHLLGEEGHTPGFFKKQNVVVGWGKTYRGFVKEILQTPSADQQKLTTPLLSNKECIELFKRTQRGVVLEISVEKHLCAGGEIGKDSCNGDSGGPLVGREQPLDHFTLIGLVSGGAKTCGRGTPAIYTRVSHYRNWILSQMI